VGGEGGLTGRQEQERRADGLEGDARAGSNRCVTDGVGIPVKVKNNAGVREWRGGEVETCQGDATGCPLQRWQTARRVAERADTKSRRESGR
jgi:hypothetical protein